MPPRIENTETKPKLIYRGVIETESRTLIERPIYSNTAGHVFVFYKRTGCREIFQRRRKPRCFYGGGRMSGYPVRQQTPPGPRMPCVWGTGQPLRSPFRLASFALEPRDGLVATWYFHSPSFKTSLSSLYGKLAVRPTSADVSWRLTRSHEFVRSVVSEIAGVATIVRLLKRNMMVS